MRVFQELLGTSGLPSTLVACSTCTLARQVTEPKYPIIQKEIKTIEGDESKEKRDLLRTGNSVNTPSKETVPSSPSNLLISSPSLNGRLGVEINNLVVQRFGHQPFTLAVEMAIMDAMRINPALDLKSVDQVFTGLPRESSKEEILEKIAQLPTSGGPN